MMSARTGFLVWWGLPILSVGVGAGLAAYAGQGGTFGSRPGQIGPLMLAGGYFAAVGLLAVILRIRQNQVALRERGRFDKPVEAALVAMCAPVLAIGLWVSAASLMADFGPSWTVAGKLTSVDQVGAFGRTYGIGLDRTARPLMLECPILRNCGSPTPLMRLKPGAQVEMQVLKGQVLGLKADGRVLVDAAAQRRWRLLFGAAALALLVVYTAAFIGASMQLLFADDVDEQDIWRG
jgi:hypothetical protein